MPASVLIVDDDDRLRQMLGMLVAGMGHEEIGVQDVPAAVAILERRAVDLIITDLRMPGASGLDLLDAVQGIAPDVPVILLTAYGTVRAAVDAMHKGACDYLLKPFDTREMENRITRALSCRRYAAENAYLRTELDEGSAFSGLIGVSRRFQEVIALIKRVASAKSSLLITGETGTGKEVVARSIHLHSPRHQRLLVPVNLAAVPGELLESELFGHSRGAFTGATADRAGKFEVADGGTLFLDEISDTPLSLQPKLLRVLQDGVVERVGSNERRQVDVRTIAASNRDPAREIEAGRFRADLYYRLRVVEIHLPPLRERREDIRYLTAHFLRVYGARRSGAPVSVSERALRKLEDYAWPGNVRELENVIERAVVLTPDGMIDEDLLDLRPPAASVLAPSSGLRLTEALERIEREIIVKAIDEANNIKTRAARLLGVSERSLWYKLRKHGLS